MPEFLAVHVLPSPMTTEQGTPLAKKVKANSTVDAYWVRSWGQSNKEGKIAKLFCEWNATNIEAVRKVLASARLRLSKLFDAYPLVSSYSQTRRGNVEGH